MKRNNPLKVAALVVALLAGTSAATQADMHTKSGYYIVHVSGEVTSQMASDISSSLRKAEAEKAERVLFIIDSPGGYVDAMHDITFMMDNGSIPVDTFVIGVAASAADGVLGPAKRAGRDLLQPQAARAGRGSADAAGLQPRPARSADRDLGPRGRRQLLAGLLPANARVGDDPRQARFSAS